MPMVITTLLYCHCNCKMPKCWVGQSLLITPRVTRLLHTRTYKYELLIPYIPNVSTCMHQLDYSQSIASLISRLTLSSVMFSLAFFNKNRNIWFSRTSSSNAASRELTDALSDALFF